MKNLLLLPYRIIGSILFFAFLVIFTVIYGILCLFFYKLPCRVRYSIIKLWTHTVIFAVMILCGIRYRVIGRENIPATNCVILSKHQSTWETFALLGIFSNPVIILKKELLHIPFFGWGLRLLQPISIDRKNTGSAMEQILTQGIQRLKEGRWVLLFPEGTRMKPGTTGRYHSGGAVLACKAGYPCLPVAHNAGLYWPKGGFLKKPGIITVIIGPLISTENATPSEVTTKVRDWIETTMKTLEP